MKANAYHGYPVRRMSPRLRYLTNTPEPRLSRGTVAIFCIGIVLGYFALAQISVLIADAMMPQCTVSARS